MLLNICRVKPLGEPTTILSKGTTLSSTYSIAVTGIQAGIAKDTAIKQLAELLQVAEEKATSMLESQKFIVKNGVDLATSAKYEAALRKCGCDVIVEPDDVANDLTFDFPESSKPELSSPTTQPFTEQPNQSIQPSNSGGFLWLIPMILWLIPIILLSAPLVWALNGIMGNPLASLRGSNILERATRVGVSDAASFQAFKEAGGLGNEYDWRGYATTSVEIIHNSEGKLGMLSITLYKDMSGSKLASFNNLKKSLSDECGNDWGDNEEQSRAGIYMAKNNGISCIIRDTGGSTGSVNVMIGQQ